MRIASMAPLFLMLLAAPLRAGRNEPETVRMTVYPCATTQPALRYHLLPDAQEQREGNAAEVYHLAFAAPVPAWSQEMSELLAGPMDRLRGRSIAEPSAVRQLEIAARRTYCHWALPLREAGSDVPLAYFSSARDLSDRLALRARIKIASGEYGPAIESLQTGFAMGRHLAEAPLLVHALISASVADQMLDRVADLAQAKDGPNLYWALANLPRPMVDRARAVQGERAMPLFNLPALRDHKPEDLSDSEAKAVLDRIMAGSGGRRVETTALLIRGYDEARQQLAQRGFSREQIEALPTSTVLVVYLVEQYQREADNLYKWEGLAYWESAAGVGAAQDALARSPVRSANPLLSLLPDIARANYAMAAVDRKAAMLQCIEAIRAYAAAHGGAPPASLADLTEMPAPLDPLLGKPFTYSVEENVVTLRGGRPPRGEADWEKVYVVTIAR